MKYQIPDWIFDMNIRLGICHLQEQEDHDGSGELSSLTLMGVLPGPVYILDADFDFMSDYGYAYDFSTLYAISGTEEKPVIAEASDEQLEALECED